MKKKEPAVRLTKEESETINRFLRDYCAEQFELEIGHLAADLFLDFITEKIAPFYYNHAIEEAIGMMTEKTEDLYLLMKENQRE